MTGIIGDQSRELPRAAGSVPAWIGIGRAVGGAIIFSLPMMLTMEMWWIGFYIEPLRLMALILVSLPLFVGISSMIGFRENKSLWDNVIDVLVAYAVAFATTALVLITIRVVNFDTSLEENFSMVLLQTVPATLGALLARSLVKSDEEFDCNDAQNYRDELVILLTGALFLAFNVAPTEEMVAISYAMTSGHVLALMLLTVLIMHMFTVASEHLDVARFRQWSVHRVLFVRFTGIGYVLSFAVSLFMLWVFGRADNVSMQHLINTAVVLSFPAGVGASASRLII